MKCLSWPFPGGPAGQLGADRSDGGIYPREVIAEKISGKTRLSLPGRDNLALLITRIK